MPLDVSVSPSAQVAVPSDVVDAGALRAISDQVQIYPVVRSTVTAFAGSSLASALPLTGVDPQALTEIHEFAATTGTKLSATELAGRLSADNGGSNGPVIPAGTRRLSVPAQGANSDIVVGVWVATGNGREFMIPLGEHGSELIAELDGTQELTVRAVEVAESASFQMHRQHGVGEGQNDKGLASGDLRLGQMQADGRALDWSWSAWGSDRATVSATEDSVSAHYQIGETRVVIVPGFASLAVRRRWPWPSTPLPPPGRARPAISASPSTDEPWPAKIVAVLPRTARRRRLVRARRPGGGHRRAVPDRARHGVRQPALDRRPRRHTRPGTHHAGQLTGGDGDGDLPVGPGSDDHRRSGRHPLDPAADHRRRDRTAAGRRVLRSRGAGQSRRGRRPSTWRSNSTASGRRPCDGYC